MSVIKLVKDSFEPEWFDELYEIETECFPAGQRFSKSCMKRYIKTNVLLTAWDDNLKIVGMLLLKVNKTFAYVSSVATLPEYRGYGIANSLLAMAESIDRGDVTKIRLHVRPDNPAQLLYFKRGYRVMGYVPKFYSDGVAALVMEK